MKKHTSVAIVFYLYKEEKNIDCERGKNKRKKERVQANRKVNHTDGMKERYIKHLST